MVEEINVTEGAILEALNNKVDLDGRNYPTCGLEEMIKKTCGTGRNIGDIFYTSRLDNELNGAVDADGAIYSVEAFTGEKSVPALLAEGKLPSVSMAEYESIVSANGSCRAWGWDGGDTFRVPTVKALLLTKEQAAVIGNGMTLGLTVGGDTGYGMAYGSSGLDALGSNFGHAVGSVRGTTPPTSVTVGVTTDPEKSGVVANLDVIEYRAMVQIATGVKEDATQLKEYKFNNPHFFGESMYSENAPYNASWLASNGTYNSSAVYPDMYTQLNSVELNGSLNVGDTIEIDGKTYVKRGLPVVLSTGTITDYDFVVNQNDQTFRLPLLNGEEDLPDWANAKEITIPYTSEANGYITGYSDGIGDVFYKINNTLVGETAGTDTWRSRGNIQLLVKNGDVFSLENGTTLETDFNFVPAIGNGSLYFYVGDTLQDPAVINAGHVLTNLATKTNSIQAAAASMPSSRYIDLTLLASGSTYTAPANGWVYVNKQGGANQFFNLNNVTKDYAVNEITSASPFGLLIMLPVGKGDVFRTDYNLNGTTNLFRFVYAEGEN